MAPLHLFEDRDRPQPRCRLEHRHDLAVKDGDQWIRSAPTSGRRHLRPQSRIVLDAIRGSQADRRLRGRRRLLHSQSGFHVQPHLMIVDVSTGHKAGTPSLGTPPQYPIGLDHRRAGPQIGGPKSPLDGSNRSQNLRKQPLQKFAILIVALAILIDAQQFKSTNDRLFIGVARDLGLIDAEGTPKPRYFEFLDRSQSTRVIAQGVREAFSDLFAINKDAQMLSTDEVKNKLRTLYQGSKKDNVIGRIASTFTALCEYA